MEISNVNERLKELEAEVNFIKELKLDQSIVYEIDGKTITFDAYDFEKKMIITIIEWDDEEEKQIYIDDDNEDGYQNHSYYWEMTIEEYKKMMKGVI